jgi:hypothetical protein
LPHYKIPDNLNIQDINVLSEPNQLPQLSKNLENKKQYHDYDPP